MNHARRSHDLFYHVAPKNLGSKAGMSSTEYSEAERERAWLNTGFEPLRYLSALDFDMDRTETFAPGFVGAFEMARSHTAATGTRMQVVVLVALLNHDLQQYMEEVVGPDHEEGPIKVECLR
ncbi:hypothetical protein GGX14DRAFT_581074 [Mycena pura]|uniref:Uncharacterized protein n=1 Tax=Mycena pura TaxID=153505 RepID=A0AAD6UJP0_9AGAR|nr:hypothetical protein GGX14DRAFT_581074 [Mycena pura]